MSAEGGRPVRIGGETFVANRPRWAPGGLRIVLLSGDPSWRAWVVSRDSVGGRWHEPAMLADLRCWPLAWAPNGTGVLCQTPDPLVIFLLSGTGQVLWRQGIPFTLIQDLRYSPDGKTVYFEATHLDGRRGIWAITDGGRGAVRLVVAFDDPAIAGTPWLSVGPDRLYASVAEYESDIWVSTLHW
jgi:hypothetical protein